MALSRTKKTILLIVSVIIILLLIAVIGGPLYLERKIRLELESSLEEALSASVSIGDVDIRWLKGEIMLTHIHVFEKKFARRKPMFTCGEAGIIVNTNSGFSISNLQLEKLFVSNCNIYIITEADGSTNWNIKTQENVSNESAPNFSISNIDITDANIHILNQQNKTGYHINGICFNYLKSDKLPSAEELHLLVEKTAINLENSNFEIPRIELQGNLLRDTMGYNTCKGNARVNQWFSEFMVNYNSQTRDFSFKWNTPECSFADFASLALPITLKSDTLDFKGTFSSQFNMEISGQNGLTLLEIRSRFNNAKLTNTDKGIAGGISGECNFVYQYSDGHQQRYQHDSLIFFTGNDILKWNLDNINNEKIHNRVSCEGNISLDSVNTLLSLNKIQLVGLIKADKNGRSEGGLCLENAGIRNTITNDSYLFDSTFVSFSPSLTQWNLALRHNSSNLFSLAGIIKHEPPASTRPPTLKLDLLIPQINVGFTAGSNANLGAISGFSRSDSTGFLIAYPTRICLDFNFRCDSLTLGETVLTNLTAQLKADTSKLKLILNVKSENDNLFSSTLSCKKEKPGFHEVSVKTDMHFGAVSSDFSGNIMSNFEISCEVDDSIHISENSINGFFILHTDSIEISKILLSKTIPYVHRMLDGDGLKIGETDVNCRITNSDFKFDPFAAKIDKWRIKASGNFNPYDSIAFDIWLVAKSKKLNFVERNIIKREAKKIGIDFNELMQQDNIPIAIKISGQFSKPTTYVKFSK